MVCRLLEQYYAYRYAVSSMPQPFALKWTSDGRALVCARVNLEDRTRACRYAINAPVPRQDAAKPLELAVERTTDGRHLEGAGGRTVKGDSA